MKHIKKYNESYTSKDEIANSIADIFLNLRHIGFDIAIRNVYSEAGYIPGNSRKLRQAPFENSGKSYVVTSNAIMENDNMNFLSDLSKELSEVKDQLEKYGRIYFQWFIKHNNNYPGFLKSDLTIVTLILTN